MMKDTWWVDSKGKRQEQSLVFTGKAGGKVVSSCCGRERNKNDPDPRRKGQPKGLHQVLWERGLVEEKLTPKRVLDPTSREGRTFNFLGAEGRPGEPKFRGLGTRGVLG
jgi:hypothetical protein